MLSLSRKTFIFLFAVPFFLPAQVFIKNFTAQPANSTQMYISWTVDASSSACSNLELFWSTDSFKTTSSWLYTLPTICGTSGTDESYYFQHNNPEKNGRNFYRLVSFGAYVSPIIEYDFGQDNGSYVIYPCPLEDNSVLTWKNPEGEQWVLDISNASCTQRWILTSIVGEQTSLPRSWFRETGMYYFRLYSVSGKLIKGKFVVMY